MAQNAARRVALSSGHGFFTFGASHLSVNDLLTSQLTSAWLNALWLAPVLAWQEGKGDAGGFGNSTLFQILPFLLIGVLFYFMLIAPERKKRKEIQALLENVKKNDQVVTIGGICGTVVNAAPGSSVVT